MQCLSNMILTNKMDKKEQNIESGILSYIVPATCPPFGLENGVANYNKPRLSNGRYLFSTNVVHECKSGYAGSPKRSETCTYKNKWSYLEAPKCDGKVIKSLALYSSLVSSN